MMNFDKSEFCSLVDDTLFDYLISINPNLSKNKIKQYLSKRKYQTSIKKNHLLEVDLDLINYLKVYPEYSGSSVQVIEDNQYFLVLDKPVKVHCHPLSYKESDNLLSFIASQSKYSYLLRVNNQSYDRSLLYRLDYETSGVVIFVKDIDLYKNLRSNFLKLVRKKEYYALVEGNLKERGLQTHYIKPFGRKKARMIQALEGEKESLRADMEVMESEYFKSQNRSLVRVKLHSGHRHQIRIQSKLMGHPIIGDILYGAQDFDRLMLHAYKYELLADGTSFAYSSSLPNIFKKSINHS